MKPERVEAVVVGGGISGLSLSYFLHQRNRDVILLEKKDRVGGVIQSFRKGDFLMEAGPNSLLDTHPLLRELVDELGLSTQLVEASPEAKNRYILKEGKLCKVPADPLSFLSTPLFSLRAKLGLLREPFISPLRPNREESLASFVTRRLGREFLDWAIDPFVAGVYAGKPEKLSVKSAFPKLYALEQEYGSLIKGAILGFRKRQKRKERAKSQSRMFSFEDGLETLTQTLSHRLGSRVYTQSRILGIHREGEDYHLQVEIDGQGRYFATSSLILTIPAYSYPSLGLSEELRPPDSLKDIRYAPVAVVYMGFSDFPFQATSQSLDGFGFLIPSREKRSILGSLWNTSIFPHRGPQGGTGLTTFIGGSRQPELTLHSEEELLKLAQEELGEILGLCRQPEVSWIRRWSRAIPQYDLGHSKMEAKLENFEKENPGLYLRGNFRGGISLPDCILNSYRLAQEIHAPCPSASWI